MVTLYIIRHGETEENLKGILQGCTPGHLTEKGKRQAAKLREQLRGITFDAIVSSDLKRATDTAEILNEAFNLPINKCVLLRERDWGSLTNMSCAKARLLKKFPDDVETLKQGMARAAKFANEMLRQYDGKTVLAVGHGFIDRCILSVVLGVSKHDVPRMENAECRILEIYHETKVNSPSEEPDEASAN